jgi:hypothetical protein
MNNKGMAGKELLFVIILVAFFFIPPIIFKQWFLLGVFAIFFVCFGLMEWLSVAKTKKTISQHFWALKKSNPVGAWIIAGSMLIAWLALLWHFLG